MTITRDISNLDLREGATADIHTNVRIGNVLVAKVHASITVLEAEDGAVKLVVDQNTEVADDVRIQDRYRQEQIGLSSDDVRATAEDPG